MKYVFIALSLLLVGSIADVPVVFLAVQGSLPLLFVVIAGFLADILPDFLWYWLGRKIGVRGFSKLHFFRQKPERLEKIGRTLDRYGAYLLFASKFMYAFGIPAQIMAGVHRYPLRKAVIANSVGSLGWLILLFVLAHFFTSSAAAEVGLKDVRFAFTAFVGFAVLIYLFLGDELKRFMIRD